MIADMGTLARSTDDHLYKDRIGRIGSKRLSFSGQSIRLPVTAVATPRFAPCRTITETPSYLSTVD